MKEIRLNNRVKKEFYIIDFDHLIHSCIHQTRMSGYPEWIHELALCVTHFNKEKNNTRF